MSILAKQLIAIHLEDFEGFSPKAKKIGMRFHIYHQNGDKSASFATPINIVENEQNQLHEHSETIENSYITRPVLSKAEMQVNEL